MTVYATVQLEFLDTAAMCHLLLVTSVFKDPRRLNSINAPDYVFSKNLAVRFLNLRPSPFFPLSSIGFHWSPRLH